MSDCKLTEEKNSFKGTTLFLDGPDCMMRTAVYVSAKHDMKSALNVILWFHGWHVADIKKHVFEQDTAKGETMLRECVDKAGQDVVLIVPFLGARRAKTIKIMGWIT